MLFCLLGGVAATLAEVLVNPASHIARVDVSSIPLLAGSCGNMMEACFEAARGGRVPSCQTARVETTRS